MGQATGGTGEKTAIGRDHHKEAFTVWMAGGGPAICMAARMILDMESLILLCMHDFNATLLHLLGMDHERLTYRFQGENSRTDVHGHVVKMSSPDLQITI